MNLGEDRIDVAAVWEDGIVKVDGRPDKTNTEFRYFKFSRRFSNYGAAKLWASDFTDAQRSAPLPQGDR